MSEKKDVLPMMCELITMSPEEYIFFCIMLRTSSPKELAGNIELMIYSTGIIRKNWRKEAENTSQNECHTLEASRSCTKNKTNTK